MFLNLLAALIISNLQPTSTPSHTAIEKALRDPARRDKEAKADVYGLRLQKQIVSVKHQRILPK